MTLANGTRYVSLVRPSASGVSSAKVVVTRLIVSLANLRTLGGARIQPRD
jgi:hypothetical protein